MLQRAPSAYPICFMFRWLKPTRERHVAPTSYPRKAQRPARSFARSIVRTVVPADLGTWRSTSRPHEPLPGGSDAKARGLIVDVSVSAR